MNPKYWDALWAVVRLAAFATACITSPLFVFFTALLFCYVRPYENDKTKDPETTITDLIITRLIEDVLLLFAMGTRSTKKPKKKRRVATVLDMLDEENAVVELRDGSAHTVTVQTKQRIRIGDDVDVELQEGQELPVLKRRRG